MGLISIKSLRKAEHWILKSFFLRKHVTLKAMLWKKIMIWHDNAQFASKSKITGNWGFKNVLFNGRLGWVIVPKVTSMSESMSIGTP